ncbi:MAG: F0F1 ATP synthase subunit gamma, partial [Alphaproteobacteria bacterium]|nr:F0F1 ATP synthase subunit gamma [Alphaproteobacteria bacterium]
DYDMGGFDIATLYYANFINVLTQETTSYQIIPQVLKAGAPEDTSKEENTSTDLKGAVYDYEPDESTILESLLPRYVAVQILRALLENAAGEQGARMSAMDSATRNAGEMIDALSITYNRSRQAQITKELIEIISGAEALQ